MAGDGTTMMMMMMDPDRLRWLYQLSGGYQYSHQV